MKYLILAMVILAGCAGKTIYVPVSSCPPPPAISMPELAVSRLPQKPAAPEALKAMIEDHLVLKSSLGQCITALDAYSDVKK